MIQRAVEQEMNKERPRTALQATLDSIDRPKQPEGELDTEMVALLGGTADAASTYTFLKRGTGVEGNAALGWAKNKPLVTALAAQAGAMGMIPVRKAIRKIPKVGPQVADALAANVGALQGAYAGHNLTDGKSATRYRQDISLLLQEMLKRRQK
jgi:hypothetical protein